MLIEETKSFEMKRGIEVWNCCEAMVIVEMVIYSEGYGGYDASIGMMVMVMVTVPLMAVNYQLMSHDRKKSSECSTGL